MLTLRLLITTIVVFNLFFIDDQITDIWNEKSVLTSRFTNVWSQIKTNMSNFHPLVVVDRRSEKQLQAGENLNN